MITMKMRLCSKNIRAALGGWVENNWSVTPTPPIAPALPCVHTTTTTTTNHWNHHHLFCTAVSIWTIKPLNRCNSTWESSLHRGVVRCSQLLLLHNCPGQTSAQPEYNLNILYCACNVPVIQQPGYQNSSKSSGRKTRALIGVVGVKRAEGV